MKIILTMSLIALPIVTNAAFKLKPGLWEIQTKATVNGKTHDMNDMQLSDQNFVQSQARSKCKITDKKDLADGVRFNIQCDKGTVNRCQVPFQILVR